MSKSEYIIWKCETREQIRSEHPLWESNRVEQYLNAVEKKLIGLGLMKKEF